MINYPIANNVQITPYYSNKISPTEPPEISPVEMPPILKNTVENRIAPSAPQINTFECGQPEYEPPKYSGLIINGYTAARAQFPW